MSYASRAGGRERGPAKADGQLAVACEIARRVAAGRAKRKVTRWTLAHDFRGAVNFSPAVHHGAQGQDRLA
jgi:hypothetical protein